MMLANRGGLLSCLSERLCGAGGRSLSESRFCVDYGLFRGSILEQILTKFRVAFRTDFWKLFFP